MAFEKNILVDALSYETLLRNHPVHPLVLTERWNEKIRQRKKQWFF
jgi:hypothetical protein